MCEPNLMTFYLKMTNVNLMMVLEEQSMITKVIRIHPLGNMNFCTKFSPIDVEILYKWWIN